MSVAPSLDPGVDACSGQQLPALATLRPLIRVGCRYSPAQCHSCRCLDTMNSTASGSRPDANPMAMPEKNSSC